MVLFVNKLKVKMYSTVHSFFFPSLTEKQTTCLWVFLGPRRGADINRVCFCCPPADTSVDHHAETNGMYDSDRG